MESDRAFISASWLEWSRSAREAETYRRCTHVLVCRAPAFDAPSVKKSKGACSCFLLLPWGAPCLDLNKRAIRSGHISCYMALPSIRQTGSGNGTILPELVVDSDEECEEFIPEDKRKNARRRRHGLLLKGMFIWQSVSIVFLSIADTIDQDPADPKKRTRAMVAPMKARKTATAAQDRPAEHFASRACEFQLRHRNLDSREIGFSTAPSHNRLLLPLAS